MLQLAHHKLLQDAEYAAVASNAEILASGLSQSVRSSIAERTQLGVTNGSWAGMRGKYVVFGGSYVGEYGKLSKSAASMSGSRT